MNELNLYQLFSKIIALSKVLQGRFVIGSGYANDFNSDSFDQIFKDELGQIKQVRKYPCSLMCPPVESTNGYDEADWSKYKIQMFFMTTPNHDSSGIKNHNFNTNTSNHTIEQTWKDMKQCAVNFRKAFIIVTENIEKSPIRDGQGKDVILRYKNVGADGIAGVGIEFEVMIHESCDLSDYNEEDLLNIQFSKEDLHPLHKH